MEGFDFSEAFIDPWATTSPLERFYVVVIRTTQGNAMLQLVKTVEGDMKAVEIALGSVPARDLANLKDVNSIDLQEVGIWAEEVVADMIGRITGVTK